MRKRLVAALLFVALTGGDGGAPVESSAGRMQSAEPVTAQDAFTDIWEDAGQCVMLPPPQAALPPPRTVRAAAAMRWMLADRGARPGDPRWGAVPELAGYLGAASTAYAMDVDALVALGWTESSFHIDARGALGEIGFFQLYGAWAEGVRTVQENIDRGTKRLALARDRCDPDARGYALTAAQRAAVLATVDWAAVYGHYRGGDCDPALGKYKAWLLRRLKRGLEGP